MLIDWQALGKELAEKNNVTHTSTFADVVKYKAETVGEKVFMTYIRDFSLC